MTSHISNLADTQMKAHGFMICQDKLTFSLNKADIKLNLIISRIQGCLSRHWTRNLRTIFGIGIFTYTWTNYAQIVWKVGSVSFFVLLNNF